MQSSPCSGTPRKRPRGSDSSGGPSHTPSNGDTRARVRFGMVRIRTHGVEIWGGGGVPADDGPPLGLGWDVQGERSVDLDDFETERKDIRTPKDSYCMLGCVEPVERQQMLLGSGSTLKQIKAVTRQVAELNQERWKASELLFGDTWLFRAPRHADAAELLAMLGQPDGRGCELSAANWHTAEACAKELAPTLGMSLEALLSSTSTPPSSDGEEGTSALPSDELGQDIVWTAASEAMQALSGHLVLIIRCDHALPNTGINLLGRLVGCVANAHIAAQVMHSQRGNVSVVLRGWADDKIEADWSDEEPDEFCISPLH